MLFRAGRVPTGGARNPVGTGAVEADERVAAAAVGAVEAPTAAGCGTGGGSYRRRVGRSRGGFREPGEEGGVAMAVTRAWHSRSSVWAASRWPRKTESLEMRGAATRSCSAVPRSIAWRSGSVMAEASAETRARASPTSTSWRETLATSAC